MGWSSSPTASLFGEYMNSHNEKKEYLTFSKMKIDISNVPYGRIVIAMDLWNDKLREHEQQLEEFLNKNDDMDNPENKKLFGDLQAVQRVEFKSVSDNIGLYLIRQPLQVLNRRYFFIKSRVEFIKRYFITEKKLNYLNKEQYEEFDEWVYFTMTGKKKEDLLRQKSMLDLLVQMSKELEEKINLTQEECAELLQTSLGGIVEGLTNSIRDHKV